MFLNPHGSRNRGVTAGTQGALVPLFVCWCIDPMSLYIVFPPNRHVSKKLQVFINWIVELMAQHAPVVGRGSWEDRSDGLDARDNA